jgi:hypothetical protein
MQRGAAGQNAPSRLSTRPPFGKFSVADRSARQAFTRGRTRGS